MPFPRRHLVSFIYSCPSLSSHCPALLHCLLGSLQYLIHLCTPSAQHSTRERDGVQTSFNRPMSVLSSVSLDLTQFYWVTDLWPPGPTRGPEEAGIPEILIFPSFLPTACHPITNLQLLHFPLSLPQTQGDLRRLEAQKSLYSPAKVTHLVSGAARTKSGLVPAPLFLVTV